MEHIKDYSRNIALEADLNDEEIPEVVEEAKPLV